MHGVGALGICVFILISFLFSENRKAVSRKIIPLTLGSQLILVVLVLGVPAWGITPILRPFFAAADTMIVRVLDYSLAGSQFVFGDFANQQKFGFIFAFQVLPTIIFMSSLMALFYHYGIMQIFVNFIARIMHKALHVSGAESLAVAANIFLGQTEAPLVVKPFLARMTRSELFAVMVSGMASVAGGVLAAYAGLLRDKIPDIAGHLLAASVLSAPSSFLFAKILIPETGKPETLGCMPKENEEKMDINGIEAAARGAGEGLLLAFNVAAMLIAFTGLVALGDSMMGFVGDAIHFDSWGNVWIPEILREREHTLSLSLVIGWLFAPVAWLLGIPWSEAPAAGIYLGQKLVLNEFVAYANLAKALDLLSVRTTTILSYALCGFANFVSIAIQIGGIGALAPSRRKDLAQLGLRCVLAGTLSTMTVAALVGEFL